MRRVFVPGAALLALGAILTPLGGMSAAEASTAVQPAVNSSAPVTYYNQVQPDGSIIPPWEEKHEQRLAAYRESVAECKEYTPYTYRNDPAAWQRFCDGLPAPVTQPYGLWDIYTGGPVK